MGGVVVPVIPLGTECTVDCAAGRLRVYSPPKLTFLSLELTFLSLKLAFLRWGPQLSSPAQQTTAIRINSQCPMDWAAAAARRIARSPSCPPASRVGGAIPLSPPRRGCRWRAARPWMRWVCTPPAVDQPCASCNHAIMQHDSPHAPSYSCALPARV